MMLFVQNCNVGVKKVLELAGYTLREDKGDYIREEHDGRFHAKILNSKTAEFHFDLYIGWRHWSPTTPIKHHEELKRITKCARPVQYRNWKPGEIEKLLRKH